MGHDYKKEITFLRSRLKYAVSNDLHSTVHSNKLTFDVGGTYEFHYRYVWLGLATHFYYKAYDSSRCIGRRYTEFTANANDKWIDVTFLGIFGTFTGHSISLGEDNGTLDGGLYAQFMMKNHLTDINILHMSFKKRSVINFKHIDKSLKKQ